MPELPEVETVRRGLRPRMEGARIDAVEARRPDLRFPLPDGFAERLTGATDRAAWPAREISAGRLSTGDVLVMHLGMTGGIVRVSRTRRTRARRLHHEPSRTPQHDHVVLRMTEPASASPSRSAPVRLHGR